MMSQPGTAPVPKFGSFKPKASINVSELVKSASTHRSKHDGEGRRERSRRDKASPNVETKASRNGSSHRERHDEAEAAVVHSEIEESDVFIVDKRGDTKNRDFGSLHRYSLPSYHRTGNGYVVGTRPSVRIDQPASTQSEVVIRSIDRPRGERPARELLAKRSQPDSAALRLNLPAAEDLPDVEEDFIHLRSNLKRKRTSETPQVEVQTVDYRSIEGRTELNDQPDDEDLRYASDSDTDEARISTELETQRENAMLVKATKDDPKNADAWFSLIEHQSRLIRPGVDPGSLSASEQRALADIRLSIYDRALKHVDKRGPGHDALVLGSIDEGSLVWETAKLVAKWNDALERHPTSVVLWTRYLDFVQTGHASFRYERCKTSYLRCLGILRTATTNRTEAEKADIGHLYVYILLRFTAFTRDAGYDELACASWQLILEYYFFKPPGLSDQTAQMRSLEAFWESDAPRIGEEGARGWDQFAAGESGPSRNSVPIASTTSSRQHTFASLAEEETQRLGRLQLPAATDDDSRADDPYCYVMFSDLREMVGYLPDFLPKTALINGFLCFMHLPLLPAEDDAVDGLAWHSDPYIRTELLSPPHRFVTLTANNEDGGWFESRSYTSFSLFHEAFCRFHDRTRNFEKDGEALVRFVDRCLKRLIDARPSDDVLAEYYLAFQSQLLSLEAPKTAKRLLKSRPSCLRLYNAYALIETSLGRADKARGVWSVALDMVRNLESESRADEILLWHSQTLGHIHNGRDAEALGCLVDMADGTGSAKVERQTNHNLSAGQRLRISRYLDEWIQEMRMKEKFGRAALYVECLSWFCYAVNDHTLDASLQVFGKYIRQLSGEANPAAIEKLYQAKAELINIHLAKKRPYKPALLKSDFSEGIERFPENSLLRIVYTKVKASSRIDDRLRDAVVRNPNGDTDLGLVQWSFSIAEEVRRSTTEVFGSTQNSVRAMFTKALLSPSSKVRHAPALWVMWFNFERRSIDGKASATSSEMLRVRQVFYDGLRYLPWCKAWVIMGLKYFSAMSKMTKQELRQLYDVLVERELRVRAYSGDISDGNV